MRCSGLPKQNVSTTSVVSESVVAPIALSSCYFVLFIVESPRCRKIFEKNDLLNVFLFGAVRSFVNIQCFACRIWDPMVEPKQNRNLHPAADDVTEILPKPREYVIFQFLIPSLAAFRIAANFVHEW